MGLYFDWTMILLVPAMILTMWAQAKIKSEYSKYARVRTAKGFTGAQTARQILHKNGLDNVDVELVGGMLSDHYDPRNRVLRLSNEVYNGSTIAANAIAAHEVGHAIQHARSYFPLTFRNSIVPVVNIASQAAMPLIFIGLFFAQFQSLLDIGILLFTGTVLFQIITLPVEIDASRRAMQELSNEGILLQEEYPHGKKVLTAAALTYIASAAVAVSQLVRLLVIRNSRRRN
ncbi:MAG: zinc metallopeptidase [Peptostreptococcaceae bacterium]|nr:zinc metallopeptidase [Peptostreptococcaceae bacterium]